MKIEAVGKDLDAQIGTLLVAWYGLPNDFRQEIEEESPSLARAINRISEIVEAE